MSETKEQGCSFEGRTYREDDVICAGSTCMQCVGGEWKYLESDKGCGCD